jgi:hypothetical protein
MRFGVCMAQISKPSPSFIQPLLAEHLVSLGTVPGSGAVGSARTSPAQRAHRPGRPGKQRSQKTRLF